MMFLSVHLNVTGDRKSKFSLTEDKNLYEEAHLFTHLFRHIMLYIKSLIGNISVIVFFWGGGGTLAYYV